MWSCICKHTKKDYQRVITNIIVIFGFVTPKKSKLHNFEIMFHSEMSEGGGDWVRLEVTELWRNSIVRWWLSNKLNLKVGGRILATSRTTLTSCPSSVLARCSSASSECGRHQYKETSFSYFNDICGLLIQIHLTITLKLYFKNSACVENQKLFLRMFRPEATLEPAALSPEGNYRWN